MGMNEAVQVARIRPEDFKQLVSEDIADQETDVDAQWVVAHVQKLQAGTPVRMQWPF